MIGDRWVFIDWDGSGPSSRLWELADAAQSFTLPDDSVPANPAARRPAAFADGYRADAELREGLPQRCSSAPRQGMSCWQRLTPRGANTGDLCSVKGADATGTLPLNRLCASNQSGSERSAPRTREQRAR